MTETPVVFSCGGEALIGVVTAPASVPDTALLVIVGGPQYRAGSHRQFVQLARRASQLGFAAMRFDVRGMGDSGGSQRSFEDIDDDVAAAIDAIQRVLPSVKRVGLWGLCGGASAALLYCRSRDDARVAGVSLVNPWVRSDATQARTRVKHYYVERLLQPAFWKKLLSGQVAKQAVGEFMRSVRLAARPASATQGRAPGAASTLEERMAEGLARFQGEALILLSGNDYTAKEFLETVQMAPAWQAQLARPRVRREDVADADHTFSQPEAHQRVELATMQWLERIRSHG
jgi:exosortase A-associated hydrolase 1